MLLGSAPFFTTAVSFGRRYCRWFAHVVRRRAKSVIETGNICIRDSLTHKNERHTPCVGAFLALNIAQPLRLSE